jgi:hypothetical protein
MPAIKQGFARRVLRQVRRRRQAGQETLFGSEPEHVWQRRFYDFNVWSERKRIEKLRYMHRNPVARGLVESPEHWAWSSFRAYAYGDVGVVKLIEWPAATMTTGPAASRRLAAAHRTCANVLVSPPLQKCKSGPPDLLSS